ncbi:ABC transporter ATP-binding protein [Cesiribacter sp. SM1]|uniref:ABC transporter ATP-binding protein n=1 Tax=Cesiribacter sp. SM1 TaxID=2861196 RepID=UPI001CD3ACB4|nr:ATP-binding cassette domain-containing protein [Cesiribacter sp. SM1]
MISIKNLNKRYGKLQVLNNLSVEFERGQVVSIIGPNGSGKTTTIKCLLGIVQPDSGEVYVDDELVLKQWEYRRKIGYMPQISHFPENMKVRQLFDMMKDIRKDVSELDEELIGLYNIQKMYDKRLGSLSGGMKQKVSASLAFLFQPDLLILDEPTAGLDPLSSEILKAKILKEKKRDKLILISSHIMSEIEEVADDILCMMDGRLCFYRSIAAIKEETGEARLGKAIAKLITY